MHIRGQRRTTLVLDFACRRIRRSCPLLACVLMTLPSAVEALDFRIAERSTTHHVESTDSASGAVVRHGAAAISTGPRNTLESISAPLYAALVEGPSHLLDSSDDDTKLIDNPEPNVGVLLGLGLLGLASRRYRTS
jgi:hypothetical protein